VIESGYVALNGSMICEWGIIKNVQGSDCCLPFMSYLSIGLQWLWKATNNFNKESQSSGSFKPGTHENEWLNMFLHCHTVWMWVMWPPSSELKHVRWVILCAYISSHFEKSLHRVGAGVVPGPIRTRKWDSCTTDPSAGQGVHKKHL
jgi:hypothetical protein